MVQKAQKQEGILCGEICCVWSPDTRVCSVLFFTVPTSLTIFVEMFCSFLCIYHASERCVSTNAVYSFLCTHYKSGIIVISHTSFWRLVISQEQALCLTLAPSPHWRSWTSSLWVAAVCGSRQHFASGCSP